MKASFLLGWVAALFLTACATDDEVPVMRSEYLGSWKCTETISGQSPATFTVQMSAGGGSDTLLISNFSGYGSQAIAKAIVNDRLLDLPLQDIGASLIPVKGSAVFNQDAQRLDWSYTTDGLQATAVMLKQ